MPFGGVSAAHFCAAFKSTLRPLSQQSLREVCLPPRVEDYIDRSSAGFPAWSLAASCSANMGSMKHDPAQKILRFRTERPRCSPCAWGPLWNFTQLWIKQRPLDFENDKGSRFFPSSWSQLNQKKSMTVLIHLGLLVSCAWLDPSSCDNFGKEKGHLCSLSKHSAQLVILARIPRKARSQSLYSLWPWRNWQNRRCALDSSDVGEISQAA